MNMGLIQKQSMGRPWQFSPACIHSWVGSHKMTVFHYKWHAFNSIPLLIVIFPHVQLLTNPLMDFFRSSPTHLNIFKSFLNRGWICCPLQAFQIQDLHLLTVSCPLEQQQRKHIRKPQNWGSVSLSFTKTKLYTTLLVTIEMLLTNICLPQLSLKNASPTNCIFTPLFRNTKPEPPYPNTHPRLTWLSTISAF